MPLTVDNVVGRLVENSLSGEVTDEEIRQFRTRMWAAIGGVTGRVVLLANLTRVGLLTAEVEEGLLATLRLANTKLERSAVVIGTNTAPIIAQLNKIIDGAIAASKAGGRPVERRGFRDKREAQRWLDEVLEPAERARLKLVIDAI